MARAWFFRPYQENDALAYIDLFQSRGVIALGHPELGDLSTNSPQMLKDFLAAEFPHLGNHNLGTIYASLNAFVNQMSVGDYVLMPTDVSVYLGRIESGYTYSAVPDDSMPHQRAVKWMNKVPKESLSKSLRGAMNVHRDIADLTKQYDEISAWANGLPYQNLNVKGNIISVTYPLRDDFIVSFKIPRDISKAEAKRMAQYIKSLHFSE